jgi:hypothetical protein
MQTLRDSSNNGRLKLIFHYYCAFGLTGGKKASEDTIDSSNFAKLTRESPGLLDRFGATVSL